MCSSMNIIIKTDLVAKKAKVLRVALDNYAAATDLCNKLNDKQPDCHFSVMNIDVVDNVDDAMDVLFPVPEPPKVIVCPACMPDEFFKRLAFDNPGDNFGNYIGFGNCMGDD